MVAARQSKINSYANKLTHTALTTIDNIEILKDIINFIILYKNREITKQHLNNAYQNAVDKITPRTPYVELPKNVLTNILSFITFNKTNYEYKESFAIKDVKLKYLGVCKYESERGMFLQDHLNSRIV